MPAAEVHLVVGYPEDDSPVTECPTCRFDTVHLFPVYAVTPHGVQRLRDLSACLRCEADQEHTT